MNADYERARARAKFGPKPPAALFAALAKARSEFPEIPRSRVARIQSDKGSYSFKYADLSDIFKHTTKALSKHGLGIHQDVTASGVVTTIYHESGETLVSSPWPIKPMKASRFQRDNNVSLDAVLYAAPDYQSAVQATKRYSASAALGISTDETVEGAMEPAVTADFQDTRHDGMNTGVKGVAYPPNASKEEKARLSADGIIKQFLEAKTRKGLDGVWSRNEPIIDRLNESYPGDYANVIDAFETAQTGMREASDA